MGSETEKWVMWIMVVMMMMLVMMLSDGGKENSGMQCILLPCAHFCQQHKEPKGNTEALFCCTYAPSRAPDSRFVAPHAPNVIILQLL
jgi:hypothetical protein